MNASRRKSIGVLLSMGTAAALAHVAVPRTKLADLVPAIDLEQTFPVAFGPWRVDASLPVILPAPDVQAKLDAIYNQVLSRTYVNAMGQRIMLSVAYGGDQSDAMSIHLPEVCYPAQGFQVLERKRDVVAFPGHSIPVVRLLTKLGGRTEPVTYWIVVGDEVVPGRVEQKLVKIRYAMRGQIPDGMLVRVSSIDADGKKAFELQDGFIAALSQRLSADARARVIGVG